jgi:hypothetical protein
MTDRASLFSADHLKNDIRDDARNRLAIAKAIEAVAEWTVPLTGKSAFEQGCRTGIETVLAKIATHHEIDLDWREGDEASENFDFVVSLTDTLKLRFDAETVLKSALLKDRALTRGESPSLAALLARVAAEEPE